MNADWDWPKLPPAEPIEPVTAVEVIPSKPWPVRRSGRGPPADCCRVRPTRGCGLRAARRPVGL